jgi:uncharacterized protein (DUF697 family)
MKISGFPGKAKASMTTSTACDEDKVRPIIRTAATAASVAAGGMAPFPGADNTILTPIQAAMIIAIGQCCGKSLGQADALAMLGAISMRVAGRVTSQVLVGRLPFVGNAINVGSAAVVTQSIGWAAYKILCSEGGQPGYLEHDSRADVQVPGMPVEDFKAFAQTLEGKILQTRERKNKFTLEVVEDGVVIHPKTTAPARRITDGELEIFLATFAERNDSLEDRDYRDVGLYVTYLLAILGKYHGR